MGRQGGACLHLGQLRGHAGGLALQQPRHAVGLAQAGEHVCRAPLRPRQEAYRHADISSNGLPEALRTL